VIHHVELSVFPNWVGVDQERLVATNGNRLMLSTRPLLLEGRQQTAHLVWERVARRARAASQNRVREDRRSSFSS
jgi:Lipocalin-like domain